MPGESVINIDPNGYQPSNPMDTNIGNHASDVDTNVGNNGYQNDLVKHHQNNFTSDQSPGRGGGTDSIHQ